MSLARRTLPQTNEPTGIIKTVKFDATNPVHFARKNQCYIDADGWSSIIPMSGDKGLTSGLSGVGRIFGFYETWVKKNLVIGEEWSQTFSYVCRYKTADISLGAFSMDIYAYDGEGDTDWALGEIGNLLPNFRRVCTLAADLSGLRRFVTVSKGSAGQEFWTVAFNINVRFGGTALRAKLTWNEGVSIFTFPSSRC